MLDFLNNISWSDLKYFAILIFAVLFFALSVSYLIKGIKKNKTHITDSASILMFLFIWLSTFCVLLCSDKNIDGSFLGIVESAYSALKIFYVDGSARFSLDNDVYNVLFRILYYILAFYAPMSLIYAVISSFDNLINKIKIKHFARKCNLYVFNELNERSLAIAQNFKDNTPTLEQSIKAGPICDNDFFNYENYKSLEQKNKKIFVFCDVYNQNTEASSELIAKAVELLDALIFKDDIVTLHSYITNELLKKRNKLVRYFLSGYDEIENIRHAVEISKLQEVNTIKNFGIFAFATGEANGHIIASLNKSQDFFVKRLNPAAMLAMNVLTAKENRLVSKENSTTEKDLQVLVVGSGRYGIEITKFLAWYYQRKTAKITIHLVDKDKDAIDSISSVLDSFFRYSTNNTNSENSEQYEIKTHCGLDVFSEKFTKFLNPKSRASEKSHKFDAIFVALGDDNLNTEAAMHIRMILDRKNFHSLSKINSDFKKPKDKFDSQYFFFDGENIHDKTKIFAIVHNDQIKSNIDSSIKVCEKIGIIFTGSNSTVYRCENIFNAYLEHKAFSQHLKRSENNDITSSFIDYTSSEYNALSSLSEALHHEFIDSLYEKDSKDYMLLRQKIGNKRWNTFLRSMGYTAFPIDHKDRKALFENRFIEPLPKRQWHRGKWHNSIVPFDELPKDEQKNNYRVNRENDSN